ncbi:MAG: hypothetical protein IPN95_26335 [Bacteroidetes bacterium]|nr:hypothetical protein [Bacteroidota bacterium]
MNSIGNIISVGDFNVSADFDPGAGVLMLPYAGADDMFVPMPGCERQPFVGASLWFGQQ